MSFDVFKKALNRSNCFNLLQDKRPEVSWVFCSKLVSGNREWLAWIPSSEDVHFSSKSFSWEGFNIRPNRCGSHLIRLHFLHQVCNDVCFDFHASDDSMVDSSKAKSSFDSTVSGAKADDIFKFFGTTHIFTHFLLRMTVFGE